MLTKLMITYLIQIIFFISLSLVDAGTIWDDAPIQLKQFTPIMLLIEQTYVIVR